MKTDIIDLKPPYEKSEIDGRELAPQLTAMLHDNDPSRKYPSVVVVPGGSYMHCSKREGEPCAARWYAYGYNAFVLDYSCVGKKFPTALLELCEALRFIRNNAEQMQCDGRIIVCGFSAGGHLAASLGVHYDKFGKDFGGDDIIRPDGMVLSYPVITTGEYTHSLSAENIAPTEELREITSLEKHVSADTPPAFIWHCADDKTVPVQNSLMMADALSRNNIPFELHIFPQGGHGIALCDKTTVKDNDPRYINPTAAQWFELAAAWAERLLDE